MITAGPMRAARALLERDEHGLAERSSLTVPTIRRMEASDGLIGGNMGALSAAGIELIVDGASSSVRRSLPPGMIPPA